MRARSILVFAAALTAGAMITAQAPKRFNPMVELHAAKKPVFGLYAPSNRRMGGGPGGPGGAPRPAPAAAPLQKSPAQLAKVSIVYLGTHQNTTTAPAKVVIPTLTVFEKNGTFVNQQFRIQKFLKCAQTVEQMCCLVLDVEQMSGKFLCQLAFVSYEQNGARIVDQRGFEGLA